MADRKVLVKYIPKNFDPKLLVKRGRGKDKLMNVRNMLPMSLRCNVCHNYLYIGTKFNMRMQICNEETYLGIKVFRFYLKCTYCYNEICFKTDPKNHDYIVEDGGTRNYEPIKDAEQAQKLMKKMQKEEKQGNSMKFLETKTYDSKREMELMEALDDIKSLNKRHALIDPEDLLNNLFLQEQHDQKFTEDEEREIDEHFKELRRKKINELKGLQTENGQKLKEIAEEDQCESVEEKGDCGNVKIEEKQKKQEMSNSMNTRIHAIEKSELFQLSRRDGEKKSKEIRKMPKIKTIRKKEIEGKKKIGRQEGQNQ